DPTVRALQQRVPPGRRDPRGPGQGEKPGWGGPGLRRVNPDVRPLPQARPRSPRSAAGLEMPLQGKTPEVSEISGDFLAGQTPSSRVRLASGSFLLWTVFFIDNLQVAPDHHRVRPARLGQV